MAAASASSSSRQTTAGLPVKGSAAKASIQKKRLPGMRARGSEHRQFARVLREILETRLRHRDRVADAASEPALDGHAAVHGEGHPRLDHRLVAALELRRL